MTAGSIRGISSMATQQLLAELVDAYQKRHDVKICIESVGGVDAAKRVQNGEAFDVVVLAADAINRLIASGHVLADSRVDLVHSSVAVAVRKGAAHPDISSEKAVRTAVLSARSLGYSTGPSGVALLRLFEHWGITNEIQSRIVQAPAGVPVGTFVAKGEVELGFQQRSELIHMEGIDLLGDLPPEIRIVTTFSGGICASSRQSDAVYMLLDFMASSDADEAKRGQGMEPA